MQHDKHSFFSNLLKASMTTFVVNLKRSFEVIPNRSLLFGNLEKWLCLRWSLKRKLQAHYRLSDDKKNPGKSYQTSGYILNSWTVGSKLFGFKPKLSTGTALTNFTDNILQNMNAGKFTGALFLDLSKAFDTVDLHLLLQKLANIGLSISRSQITSVGDA